jgi:hypothetical protein
MVEILEKKLSDMTNAELAELRESISKIEIERLKINCEKIKKLFQELTIEG